MQLGQIGKKGSLCWRINLTIRRHVIGSDTWFGRFEFRGNRFNQLN